MSIITREPLRAEVRRVLLERLLSGKLEPGSGINEARLAAELGVSRTPLREALINLEIEGFIESSPGRGFSVAPLRRRTAQELHTLVGLLEGQAMQALRSLDDERLDAIIARLEHINAELMVESAREGYNPERLIQLGDEWHEVLMSADDNQQLHEIIALLKKRMFRYTYAFLVGRERIPSRLTQHEEIIEALKRRDIDAAIEMIKRHWIRSDAEREWLKSLPDEPRPAK